MTNEKLASDLASRVGVKVPRVEFDNVEGSPKIHSISHAHGQESIDVTLLRQRAPNQINSQEVKKALGQASGLLPFYVWTASGDFKDDHLVLNMDANGAYDVAGIDFQHSFNWPQGNGGPVQVSGMPPALAPNIDKNVVATTVAAIEAMTDEQIRDIVNSLPATVVSDAEKKRLSDGLIGRRDKVKGAMTNQGLIP
jgi:hypothetical protein